MALTRITKVGGNSLEDPLNFTGGINAIGVITAIGGFNIGIQSSGTSITSSPVKTLNFVGTGNTFAVSGTTIDISISGGGGGASVVYDATVFAYKNVINSDIDLDLPYKTSVIYIDPDLTLDIEPGFQLSVGDGVFFSIIDI